MSACARRPVGMLIGLPATAARVPRLWAAEQCTGVEQPRRAEPRSQNLFLCWYVADVAAGLLQGAHHEDARQAPSRGPSDNGAPLRGSGSRPSSADRAASRASPSRGPGGTSFAGFEDAHDGVPV